MPPRKATAPTKSAPPPPPNESHPARAQIPTALTQGHPHSSSYHSFITSPYFPTPSSSAPPKKRARVAPSVPDLVESPLQAHVLHEKLLAWYDGVKESRSMPWRKEKEVEKMSREERTQRAYEVWVSEIMLQQTQVSTVISYWTRWMERFPTVSALAAADQEEVNEVWKGLGYYSRASRLLSGAKKVVNEFGGEIPETAEGLLEVDGIGPYSAGAISSIAFGARSAMVDGNVQRVLSRLTALHANATAKSTTSFIWALADVL
ncbi:DNA glycosylase, partial [Leucosporidium creatinivorum]